MPGNVLLGSERLPSGEQQSLFLQESRIFSLEQGVEKPRCHQHVKGQPPVDSSVGLCTGESSQLRRIDNTGLAQSGVRQCIVEERVSATKARTNSLVTGRRVISTPVTKREEGCRRTISHFPPGVDCCCCCCFHTFGVLYPRN